MRETPIDPDIINSVFTAPVQKEHPYRESLINLVESLPENHRNVVELIVWGQMTKVDVAKKLGFSRSYVHKIWKTAKERMRDELRNNN
tara:strand:+ start:30 stop:293 length:264 start_codon:yes stop_codon:yes gene_type:complete